MIEVHNEQDPVARPSSLQQLQEMLDIPKNLENINQNTMDAEDIPQEKELLDKCAAHFYSACLRSQREKDSRPHAIFSFGLELDCCVLIH